MKILMLLIIALILAFPANAKPEDVEVGLYILNLGKFDVATGSFTADFYLSMKCNSNCSAENFEFMNGRAASVDKITNTPTEKFYRIQANLNSPVDLKNFPFDKQKMQIIIEDKEKVVDELAYIPLESESGIDDSIAFAGWNIDGWEAKTLEHNYKIYDEVYSQYIFTVDISRIPINSFMKTFLPVIFIILILMFSFVMDPDKITTRLTVATSGLIAAVMFHISISNQIPPVGYLTIADKFMILTYFVILAAVIIDVILLELVELKKTELAEKVHRRTEYSIFIAVPLIYLVFFLVVMLG